MTAGKRLFDLCCSALGLLLLLPLLLLIALLILIRDGWPVLFLQERVGFKGRLFTIYKFRTMVRSAGSNPIPLTIGRDARVTRLGCFLRKYKLDELPQLANVLRGEMSFVGPRPEVPHYVARYSSEQSRVLDLIPGITDPASITYRDEATLLGREPDPERIYWEQVMPDKIRINLEYAARASVRRDLCIILGTLFQVAKPGRKQGSFRE